MGKTWKDDKKRGNVVKFPRVPAMKSSGWGPHERTKDDVGKERRKWRKLKKYAEAYENGVSD